MTALSMGFSMNKTRKRAIGLMSGTSADGVDAALIETDGELIFSNGPYEFVEYSSDERAQILESMKLVKVASNNAERLKLGAQISPLITERHVVAVERLIKKAGMHALDIDVIGFHGQTLFHDPTASFTLQVGNAAGLADALSIPVVYDFRGADMLAGGQGAPLVPIYHRALARHSAMSLPIAVVNIGGVANVTYIGVDETLLAFDTGPGNVLIDEWVAAKKDERFDRDGSYAAAGQVDEEVVMRLLQDPYFQAVPPKSLDRYDFSSSLVEGLSLEDGAATLVEFTVRSIVAAQRFMEDAPYSWAVVGGGAKNKYMMQRLSDLTEVPVLYGDELGWQGGYVEAEAFGFLAVRHLFDLPLTFPGTTGIVCPQKGGRLATVS